MEDFVLTRAAQIKNNAKILHEVTTYEAPKKVAKQTKNESSIFKKHNKNSDDEDENIDDEPIDKKREQELEMKRYRYDIIKFGMTGLKKTQVRQAKIALAISLGAKPPKNKKKNYKKLMDQRKRERTQEKKKDKFSSGLNTSQLFKNRKNNFNSKQRKTKGSGILDVYGKVTKDKKQKNSEQKRKGRR